jgi:hypothetical protein
VDPDWRQLRSRWDEDAGALLDCYVPNTNVDDWQTVVNAVKNRWPWSYSEDGATTSMPEHMPDVFDRSSQVAVLWRVSLTPSVYANCHFFDVHEIEFDLDPREIVGQDALDAFCCFVQTVGRELARSVGVGVEGGPPRTPDDMRYEPSTDRVVALSRD